MTEGSEILTGLLRLRVCVGFLGEKDQCGWWDTSLLGATGQRYLAFNFPRTTLSAAVHAVTEAARNLHDQRIGRGRVFHLFRLPTDVEEGIHQALLSLPTNADLGQLISTRDSARASLDAAVVTRLTAPEGPVQVGTRATLATTDVIEELAAHYSDAFRNGRQTFPYFRG